MLTVVPFSGFYQTTHDLVLETWYTEDLDNEPSGSDVRRYTSGYAKAYLAWFNAALSLEITFESLESNNDGIGERLFGEITEDALLSVWKQTTKTALVSTLASLYTSYDGFRPYYSNDLETWVSNAGPMHSWDHNEVYTVLLAYAKTSDFIESDFEYDGI